MLSLKAHACEETYLISIESKLFRFMHSGRPHKIKAIEANRSIEMKILESFRSECSKVGMCLSVESNQKHPFNSRSVFVLISQFIGTILSSMHLFYVAKTFNEYIISFDGASGLMVVTISLATGIWNMKPLSEYLDCLEQAINGSK